MKKYQSILRTLLLLCAIVFFVTASCNKEKIKRIDKANTLVNEDELVQKVAENPYYYNLVAQYIKLCIQAESNYDAATDATKMEIAKFIYQGQNEGISDIEYLKLIRFLGFKNPDEVATYAAGIERSHAALVKTLPELATLKTSQLNDIYKKAFSACKRCQKELIVINDESSAASNGFNIFYYKCEFNLEDYKDREGNILTCPDWYVLCKDQFETCSVSAVGAAIDDSLECIGMGVSVFAGGVGASIGGVLGFFGGSILTLGCINNIEIKFEYGDCRGCQYDAVSCCL